MNYIFSNGNRKMQLHAPEIRVGWSFDDATYHPDENNVLGFAHVSSLPQFFLVRGTFPFGESR